MNISKYLFLFLTFQLITGSLGWAEDEHDHPESYATHEAKEHEGHEEHEEGVLKLSAESREMIQLKSEKVTRRTLRDRLKVYGQIARDSDNYSHINFTSDGIVEEIAVKVGDIVDVGHTLLAVRQSNSNIQKIISPSHGTVISIYVKPGDKVDRLKSLISLVNMDLLRVTIDIYEKDLRFIKIGQKVEFKSVAYPDKTFHGKVVFISPEIDEESKSIKVRVDIDNNKHLLKLGMSLSGELFYLSDHDVLVVAKDAVQTSGNESIVFVLDEHGDIEAREVVVGHAFDNVVEIKSGLKEGDEVVTHGSFYLKSELEKEAFSGDGHAH